MTDTTFVDKKTNIVASWLNDVNALTYQGTRLSDGALAAAIMQYKNGKAGTIQRSVSSVLQERLSVLDCGADPTGALDSSAAFQQAVSDSNSVYIPPGSYKLLSTVVVPGGVNLTGAGIGATAIIAYGADAFHVAAGNSNITFRSFLTESYTSGGAADPRTFVGIRVLGTSGAHCAYINYNDLFFQGWSACIENDYVNNSNFNNIVTVNSNYAIDLFGQCVGTVISYSYLVCNGGQASIRTRKDVAIQGEGLQISNTLLASGGYGITSDGFLSVGLDAGCIVDLITLKAFNFSGVSAFKCDAQWVYSSDTCFYAADQSVPVELSWNINVALATCIGSTNLVYWGSNNVGLQLNGTLNSTTPSSYPVQLNGSGANIQAKIVNSTGVESVRVNTTGNTIAHTGDRSVLWAVSPIATVGSNTALVLPRNGCPVFFISGTTSITSISAASWAGQEVTLIFQGALTLTDGSNLKLAGNFVTTADDVVKLTCDGTNWYEVSRSVN